MFRYDPANASFRSQLKEGNAQFNIVTVTTELHGNPLVSKKSGAQMMKLELKVFDANNKSETVYDWIVANFPKKLKDLCNAIGKPEWFISGELDATSLEGHEGKCIIVVKPDNKGNDRAQISEYLSRVDPMDYLPLDPETAPTDDDALPF